MRTFQCVFFFSLYSVICAQNEDCGGPKRDAPFNVPMETACSLRCTLSDQCSSYIFTRSDTNGPGLDGICQLLDKFNDNILAEQIGISDGSVLKISLHWKNILYFIPTPNHDAAQAATANSYITKIKIESLNVTRFLREGNIPNKDGIYSDLW